MAAYARSRALVPAPTTLNVIVRIVILPVTPFALAPLKAICPVPAVVALTTPVKPAWIPELAV
jgi:hypothetical protein